MLCEITIPKNRTQTDPGRTSSSHPNNFCFKTGSFPVLLDCVELSFPCSLHVLPFGRWLCKTVSGSFSCFTCWWALVGTQDSAHPSLCTLASSVAFAGGRLNVAWEPEAETVNSGDSLEVPPPSNPLKNDLVQCIARSKTFRRTRRRSQDRHL